MYCVRVIYPNQPGSSFDLKHYLSFHVPTGLELLKRHYDAVPIKVEADVNPEPIASDAHPSYHLLFSAYFPTRADAESFRKLFSVKEAEVLNRDYPNFTAVAPEITINEVIEIDPVSRHRK